MQINLNTQRLTLRSVIQNDWKALQALWIDYNRSEYCKYDAYNPVDDELVYSRVEGWNCVNHVMKNHHYLAVCYYDNLIGFFSVHPYRESYEIGYCFHSDYHGHGYASEALECLTNYLKTWNASSMYIRTGLNNIPSVNLVMRNGFKCIEEEQISFYNDAFGNPIYFVGGVFYKAL